MDEQKNTIDAVKSWTTCLPALWYPALIYFLVVSTTLYFGKSGFVGGTGYVDVTVNDLPFFTAAFFVTFLTAAWVQLHRRVTLEERSVNISSVKLPFFGDRRIPLWKLGSLTVGSTWTEQQLGLCHIEFLNLKGHKFFHDVSGYRHADIGGFIQLANEKIRLAQSLPHDPIPMDKEMKELSHHRQKVGIAVFLTSVALFVSWIYYVAHFV